MKELPKTSNEEEQDKNPIVITTVNKIFKETKNMRKRKRKSRRYEEKEKSTLLIRNQTKDSLYKELGETQVFYQTKKNSDEKKIQELISKSEKKKDSKVLSTPEQYENLPRGKIKKDPFSDFLLSPKVVKEIYRLTGVYPPKITSTKTYSNTLIEIPPEILSFLSSKWKTIQNGCSQNSYDNDEHEIYQIEFIEHDIYERKEYKFLLEHQDACLIGDGNVILCTLLEDKKNLNDFLVYILDDRYKDDFEGPIHISELLKDMRKTNGTPK